MNNIFSKRSKQINIFGVAIAVLCSFVISSTPVSAIDIDFYSANDILFYNPDDIGCGAGAATAPSININLNDTTKQIYNYLTTTALSTNGNKPLSAAQAAGIMGNMYAESGFNPSAVEDTTRTEKGHGLVQWTFGRWAALQQAATNAGKPWDDLSVQLGYLKTELEGSEKAVLIDREFSAATTPAIAALRFRVVFERADPTVAHDTKREGAAVAVFSAYSNGAAATTAASCTSTGGAVAGDIVKTAIGFALQSPASNGMVNKSDARDTYQAAKPTINPSVAWTDCGGYIATVMIASGADPDYVKVSVTKQIAYVRSHPEKYLINEKPTLASLQPGDILYTSGHTTMYTGEDKYPSVDASLDERVPSVRSSGSAASMINDGAISARIIK